MTLAEAKIHIAIAAAQLTTAACGNISPDQMKRVMDGDLSDEEKRENLEVWETFKVFCAGITALIKPENEAAGGFESLASTLGSEAGSKAGKIGDVVEGVKEITEKLK